MKKDQFPENIDIVRVFILPNGMVVEDTQQEGARVYLSFTHFLEWGRTRFKTCGSFRADIQFLKEV